MTPLTYWAGWVATSADLPSSSVARCVSENPASSRPDKKQTMPSVHTSVSRLPHHLIDKYETSARDQQQQPAELTLL